MNTIIVLNNKSIKRSIINNIILFSHRVCPVITFEYATGDYYLNFQFKAKEFHNVS